MGQTLYKIPIWQFCIYSLERLILHPQYHHTSFLDQFLSFDENHLLTPLQKTHYGDFVKTMSLWPAEDCFHAYHVHVYHQTSFQSLFCQKMRNEKIFNFFFFYHGNFAKTICLWPEENCIVLPGLKASSSL